MNIYAIRIAMKEPILLQTYINKHSGGKVGNKTANELNISNGLFQFSTNMFVSQHFPLVKWNCIVKYMIDSFKKYACYL